MAKRLDELVAWQLACDVEREVFAFLAHGRALEDVDYCRQMRRSSSAPRRDLAEGFGRFLPGDFARYVRIALGELRETRDGLDDALARGYLDADCHRRIARLIDRTIGASVNLVKYLDSCRDLQHHRRRRTSEP